MRSSRTSSSSASRAHGAPAADDRVAAQPPAGYAGHRLLAVARDRDRPQGDAGRRARLPRAPDQARDPARHPSFKAMEAEENTPPAQDRAAPAAPPRTGTIVTVFGAKGGIGKSTDPPTSPSRSPAAALSVVTLDLDNGFGDITGMLDVKPERTLLDLVRDIDNVEPDDSPRYIRQARAERPDVLAGPSVLEWREITPDQVRSVDRVPRDALRHDRARHVRACSTSSPRWPSISPPSSSG